MDELTSALAEAIRRWRDQEVADYWLSVAYIGSAVNRFGDHEMTVVDGAAWRLVEWGWRRVGVGSDFWLFTVPGAFAWARDLITKVIPPRPDAAEVLTVEYDDEVGFVRYMRFNAGQRDPLNFTFEVRRFGRGPHPDFEGDS